MAPRGAVSLFLGVLGFDTHRAGLGRVLVCWNLLTFAIVLMLSEHRVLFFGLSGAFLGFSIQVIIYTQDNIGEKCSQSGEGSISVEKAGRLNPAIRGVPNLNPFQSSPPDLVSILCNLCRRR